MKHYLTIFMFGIASLVLFACSASGTPLTSPPASPTVTPVSPAAMQISTNVGSPLVLATQKLPTPERYPTASIMTLPTPMKINEKLDLPYTTSQELLDVFSPESPGNWPVVIVLHGSGDDKIMLRPLARAIAGLGAVVFTPSYVTNKGPAGSGEDVACAVRFGRAHGSEYGAQDKRVIVVGHSLGGMMGALMMLAGDEFTGECLTPEVSALPDVEISLDGGFDPIPFIPKEKCQPDPAVCLKIDPFTYLSTRPIRSGIRFMLLVGDYLTAQKDSQAFRDALKAAGYEVSLTQIPGLDHNDMSWPHPQILSTIMGVLHPPAP